jgi:hypothetical protein
MRSKDFTKVLYETTEYIINVPIRIKMGMPEFGIGNDVEETAIDLDPTPVVKTRVVKRKKYKPRAPKSEFAQPVNPPELPKKKRGRPSKDPSTLDPNPVFVSPLQQEIELKKAEIGKDSPIIGKLTQDENEPR